jgi:hypothetical protein
MDYDLLATQGNAPLELDEAAGNRVNCRRATGYLFSAQEGTPACLRASDANDDGAIDISDAIYMPSFLFLGGPASMPTLPEPADDNPFADRLSCAVEASLKGLRARNTI